MKPLVPFALFLVLATHICAQSLKTAQQGLPFKSHFFDPAADYSKPDTISLWRYGFDTTEKQNHGDTVHFLGTLSFWRAKPIHNEPYERIYKRGWTPSVHFAVYDLADSAYCEKIGLRVKIISSCVPPNVGGDIIVIGKYILMSEGVCLNCEIFSGSDYCRPVVNYILGRIKKTKNAALKDILAQLPVKRGA